MNGRVFVGDRRVDAVPVDDRGLAYGDGLFETMRVHDGDVPWWDAHWARLARGAARLRMPLPDATRVREEARALFAAGDAGVLKLLLTRGSGGRGYAPPQSAVPTWILSHHPLPPAAGGLRLHWCRTRLASQPALAGLKHCNRLEQVLARAECVEAGADEGLLQDAGGHVVSATAANLFVLRGGEWATPPLDHCGVAGVCRGFLIPLLQARERTLSEADVGAADAVFLCNAVRGILGVARVGARDYAPHPALEDARRALARLHPAFALEAQ